MVNMSYPEVQSDDDMRVFFRIFVHLGCFFWKFQGGMPWTWYDRFVPQ